ncbi:enoyl-[acyl-carrier-protein] reductase [NADH] [Vulcanimicrobium alpinum]|uniref:Enoyl-[acyl-carrier-protein] reductase [NADH] n=1 Tax=Vulcanimicrobium alpinum TaxID=3016050 RepID=A0AAN1XVA6_UNVUL|nr:enoyl-ACP reductase [Vulcanimicrobium alpinum]BDE06076.1 enoyl-[acyl-carrier-protein] reductase [NADH] [Vulcanimicrobium alpinum]
MALLDGKTLLVTGVANRWSIAAGIAKQLHAHGARLILTYQGERVEDAVREHAREFGGAAVHPCDVTSEESLRALAAAAGPIDGLVHSIAFVKKEDLSGKVYTTSRDGFATAMDISAYSLIALVNALERNLNDNASVMALTYLGATQIVPNYNIAGIAKAALESIVRYLAFDLGERGIRVNAISAGPIKTASSRQVAGFSSMPAKVAAASPLKRNVSAEDVGNCAVYLASDLSTQVTADVHFIDAGYHAMGMYPDTAQA